MIELSEETRLRIEEAFPAADRRQVEECLLAECGDTLPLVGVSNSALAERIRFAVIKLANGEVGQLQSWVEEAKEDWRDVLVSADFAHDPIVHLSWHPRLKK